LQNYANERGWAGIEITLPPSCYSFETADLLEFALFSSGFRMVHRWLCPMLALNGSSQNAFEHVYLSRQITSVRAARRKGVVGIETGLGGLDNFLKVFRDTYDRHGVAATHTPEEIRDLLQRLPDRVRIHLAMLGEVPIAGLLVFRLTASIAYTFYICSSRDHAAEHGAAFIIADLIDRLSQDGFRYLDLGPSASDRKFNKGVNFFKEGLGALGQCRDRWRWEVD
jgi:Acetyltransferase (GNAT) domain